MEIHQFVRERFLVKGNQSMFGQGNVSSFVWDFGDGAVGIIVEIICFLTHIIIGQYDVTWTIEYADN